jgi:hypothetical protein
MEERPPGPEGPHVYKLGRRAADYILYDDVSFFLEEVDEPPTSAKAAGTILEGQDVVALGGQTIFVRLDWLRKNAPYALENRAYEEPSSLPFSTRQFKSKLESVRPPPPVEDLRDKAQKFKDRKQQAKTMRTSVVKCCLKKRVRAHELLPKIKDLVEFNAKVTHRTGLLLNWIVLTALDQRESTTRLEVQDDNTVRVIIKGNDNTITDLPDLTDQTFIDHAMALDVKDPHVARAVDKLFKYYPEIEVPKLSGKPVAQSSRTMIIANIKTYVGYTYKQHQKRFLVAWCKERGYPKGTWWRIMKGINGWGREITEDDDLVVNEADLTEDATRLIAVERRLLRVEDNGGKSTDTFRKDHSQHVIKAYHRWTGYLQSQGLKSFTVLPIGSIRAKHVDIDTITLFGMLYDKPYNTTETQEQARDAFSAMREEQWASAFRLDGLRNTFDFAFCVTTDGVSASFHFKRPMTSEEKDVKEAESKVGKALAAAAKRRQAALEKALKKAGVDVPGTMGPLTQALADNPGARIIGIDPGRTNIMVTAELVDGKVVSFRLTRAQYKTDTGMKSLVKTANKRNLRVKTGQEILDQISLKTTSPETIAKYVSRLLWTRDDGQTLYDNLWNEKLRPCHARDRFGVWKRRNQVLDNFFKKVSGGDNSVLWAYGDASFAPSGRGSETVPVQAAAKRCVTQYGRDHVGPTPEFRTSIACSGCYTRVHDVRRTLCEEEYEEAKKKARERSERTGKPYRSPHRKVSVRGLKRCSNTACENFGLRNRDKQSAEIIRKCGAGTRPSCLERGSVLPGTKKTIDILRVSKKRVSPKGKASKPMHKDTRMFGPA